MKLNQLMLAPVALGMVAPVAANAADLNIAAVNQYSESQVTSVNQFSDVRPTDWAYQALSNLVEQYGCVAGYPNGTFVGGKAQGIADDLSYVPLSGSVLNRSRLAVNRIGQ